MDSISQGSHGSVIRCHTNLFYFLCSIYPHLDDEYCLSVFIMMVSYAEM